MILELAYTDQINDVYLRSNKNQAAQQILWYYRCQHTLGIELQTIEALSEVEAVIMVEESGIEIQTFPVAACLTDFFKTVTSIRTEL